jgi:hypothetical protein
MSVPLRNWLVVHPVTKVATQQSSAATAALLEVFPKIRFVISLLQRVGDGVEEVNGPTSIVGKCPRANSTPSAAAFDTTKTGELPENLRENSAGDLRWQAGRGNRTATRVAWAQNTPAKPIDET